MLLLVAYVASTRHFRRDMDVTTFMATICPIAAVAVLPLALAHGDVFGMSGTGWTYMLILTLTSGVAAQGLLVYAQKTIQIGTIGIAQVAQPALAVVWSFLLLGEVINGRQIAGIAIVIGGLLGVHRAQPARRSTRSRSVMKCEAAAMRASAARVAAVVARSTRAGERVEREDLDRRVAVAPRVARGAPAALAPAPSASSAASRHSPSAACSPPPAARCHAAAASSAARASRVAAERAQHAPEVHAAERGQAHVAGRLGLRRSPSASVAAPAS